MGEVRARVFVMAGPDKGPKKLAAQVEAFLERCRARMTPDIQEAGVVLGLGDISGWPAPAPSPTLSGAVPVWVWFETFCEPEVYARVRGRWADVHFLHGAAGLEEIGRNLERVGVLTAQASSDPLAEDAFFRMRGDYLFGVQEDFEALLRGEERQQGGQGLAMLLGRIAGAAGTYEFPTLSRAALKGLARCDGLAGGEGAALHEGLASELRKALRVALLQEQDSYSRQVQASLPAIIDIDVRQRVLVLANDPQLANQMRFALSHSRIEALVQPDATAIVAALHSIQPDILIVQQALGSFDGVDIATHVRGISRFEGLPILALLHESSSTTLDRVIRGGVDAWLLTPVPAAHVAMTVLHQLRRVEVARKLGGRDALTGIYTREALFDRLRQDLSRVARAGQKIGVVLVHLSESETPRADFLELTMVANRVFRQSDLLARYNELTLAVVLPGVDIHGMVTVLGRLERAIPDTYLVHIVATLAAGTATPEGLMADVEGRLTQALSGVTEGLIGLMDSAVGRRKKHTSPRILIADPDAAIVKLLTFFCSREGFETEAVSTGTDLLEKLVEGRDKDELPDMVVMEAYLPGVDGFQVLEKMRIELAGQVPVIMLSVRPGEDRVTKAFELGVSDFVAKPFSVPEMVARIRNGLARNSVI